MSREILIHVHRNWRVCYEIAEAIKDSLLSFGFDTKALYYRDRSFPSIKSLKNEFIISFAHKTDYSDAIDFNNRIIIFIETDHIWYPGLRVSNPIQYSRFARSLHFFDYGKDLRDQNIYYFPLGYHKAFDTTIEKRDLRDTFSLGSAKPIRKAFRENFNLFAVEDQVWGQERDELIMTSKVNINSAFDVDYWHSPLHASLILFKGKMLMQEDYGKDDYNWHAPYLVLFNQENFKEKLDYWVNHDKERREFEDYIYTEVKKHKFEDYLYNSIGDLLESYR
jgi:hypothetical protein